MKKPFVLIISGVAGSGKDSLLEELWRHHHHFEVVVSYTDRPPRPGEIEGKNYHFISKADFDRGIAKKEFIEWEATRGETRYGRKKADFKRAFQTGKTVAFVVDVLGFVKYKKIYDTASVFVVAPSTEEAMKRVKQRSSDTPEGLKLRLERYNFELSYKSRYDHVIVNDDLVVARRELLQIAKKEQAKRDGKKILSNVFFGVSLFILIGGFTLAYAYNTVMKAKVSPPEQLAEVEQNLSESNPAAEEVTAPALPTPEVKKKVAATPPKDPTNSKIQSSTSTNSDGSQTTTVSTAGVISQADLAKLSASATSNTPLGVSYYDETGSYAASGDILKNYLNSTLRWKNEISFLSGIMLKNAGASGWNGQYLGSYTTSAGKIISASGSIIINTYYIENQYCSGSNNFSGCANEYAKLILAHEYGHHYTLYHKWVDLNLSNVVRFPDSYYNVRPLSKTGTTVDYSLGWSNCDVEIIAEDYSYFYSGYGLHAMSTTVGLPSAGTKTWLDAHGTGTASTTVSAETPPVESVPEPSNTAPVITISAPAEGATVSGSLSITAEATDDTGVQSVSFYIDGNLITTDSSAPYSTSLNSASYANTSHALKAVATDGSLSAEKSITLVFANTLSDSVNPTISLLSPVSNPHTLVGNNVNVSVQAADNTAIDRIELYFDDQFQQSWQTDSLNLTVSFKNVDPGNYILKFKTYDTAGNVAETVLTVIKS